MHVFICIRDNTSSSINFLRATICMYFVFQIEIKSIYERLCMPVLYKRRLEHIYLNVGSIVSDVGIISLQIRRNMSMSVLSKPLCVSIYVFMCARI